MFSRVIASLLVLVMFWSALAAQEQAFRPDTPEAGQQVAALAGGSSYAGSDGSVADHHLDDQPAQAHAEHLADLPCLLQVRPEVQAPALAMAAPARWPMNALHPPYLDTPQRPPCAAGFTA